jgi:hypothetical protein
MHRDASHAGRTLADAKAQRRSRVIRAETEFFLRGVEKRASPRDGTDAHCRIRRGLVEVVRLPR